MEARHLVENTTTFPYAGPFGTSRDPYETLSSIVFGHPQGVEFPRCKGSTEVKLSLFAVYEDMTDTAGTMPHGQ